MKSTYQGLNFDYHCGGGEAEDRMTQREIAHLSEDQTVASLAQLQEKLVIVERKLLICMCK